MKKIIFIVICLINSFFLFSQGGALFEAKVGASTFLHGLEKDNEIGFKPAFGISYGYEFSKGLISYQLQGHYTNVGAKRIDHRLNAHLNYLGITPSISVGGEKVRFNVGAYFSFLLNETTPHPFPPRKYHYKRSDIGLNINPIIRLTKVGGKHLFLSPSVMYSLTPIHLPIMGYNLPVHPETRNLGLFIGIMYK